MNWAILSQDGLLFLLRWGHFIFGIAWIGMLWYFNFAQGAFMNAVEPDVKKAVNQKLAPTTLWYFRWGAMGTFLTGWIIIFMRILQGGMELFSTSWGVTITTGAVMGTLMWFNVWFVIWPRQKQIIAAANGEKVDNIPVLARRAFLASRTNTLLSVPLLFFMAAASHLPIQIENPRIIWGVLVAVLLALLEINALTADKGPTTKPLEKVSGVIHYGLLLTVIMYICLEVLL